MSGARAATFAMFEQRAISHAREVDRVLPHNLEAERAVLGSILLDVQALVLASAIIIAADFYRVAHRWLFAAMLRLHSRGAPIELVTLREELAPRELDEIGPAYITALVDGVPRSMNIEHYARIVKEKAILRGLASVANGILADVYEAEDPTAIVREATRSLEAIALPAGRHVRKAIGFTLAELSKQTFPARRQLLVRADMPVFQEGQLGQIYATRGYGKSWFATTLAIIAGSDVAALGFHAPERRRVLIVDGEMASEDVKQRAITLCERLGVDIDDVQLTIVAADWQAGYLPRVDTAEGQSALEPFVADADLIFFDNRSCLFDPEAEKDAGAWQPGQDYLLSLRRRGKSGIVVHHANRQGAARGHSKAEDILNLSIQLQRPDDYQQDQGARFTVVFDKARGAFGPAVASFTTRLTPTGWSIEDSRPTIADPPERKLLDYLAAATAANERPTSATSAIAGARIKKEKGLTAWGRLLKDGAIQKDEKGGFYLTATPRGDAYAQ